MDIVLLIPGHIKTQHHIRMAKEKSKFVEILKKSSPDWLNIEVIYSCDLLNPDLKKILTKDFTFRNFNFDHYIDLENIITKGIVRPTKCGIKYTYCKYGPKSFFARTGQDCTLEPTKFIKMLSEFKTKVDELFMLGGSDTDKNFKLCFDDEQQKKKVPVRWRFCQGNFMFAPTWVWNKYYVNNLPPRTIHYADDSVVSWLIHDDGGELIHYKNKFWKHHQEKNFPHG